MFNGGFDVSRLSSVSLPLNFVVSSHLKSLFTCNCSSIYLVELEVRVPRVELKDGLLKYDYLPTTSLDRTLYLGLL